MTLKEEKFIETWKIAKKMGKMKYAITYGAFFGIFTFIVSNLIMFYVFSNKEYLQFSYAIIQLVLFIIIGFIISYFFTWKSNTIKYNNLIKK